MTNNPILSYEVPIPETIHQNVNDLYLIDSEAVFRNAQAWKDQYLLRPARKNKHQVTFVGIDWQIDFCSQNGALSLYPQAKSDVERVVNFIYRNARAFTRFVLTLDSHLSYHIFSPIFWIDVNNKHPEPYTQLLLDDLLSKKYRVNPEMAYLILGSVDKLSWLEDYAVHYVKTLAQTNKPPLVIWPLHCEIGSAGHLLVPAIYEAICYVSYARYCPLAFDTKATEPLTESYGPFAPEILHAHDNTVVGKVRTETLDQMLSSDILIFSGEAKSHCLKTAIEQIQEALKTRYHQHRPLIYILSCTSNVPGFESQGDKAFARFATEEIHIVSPETPIIEWPQVPPNFADNI